MIELCISRFMDVYDYIELPINSSLLTWRNPHIDYNFIIHTRIRIRSYELSFTIHQAQYMNQVLEPQSWVKQLDGNKASPVLKHSIYIARQLCGITRPVRLFYLTAGGNLC